MDILRHQPDGIHQLFVVSSVSPPLIQVAHCSNYVALLKQQDKT